MGRNYAELKEKIVKKIREDVRINASDITVSVSSEGIALGGIVANYFQKITAGRLAWNVKGVTHVKNQIKVAIPEEMKDYTDQNIKTNIQSLLKWTQSIGSSDINVTVSNGNVTLTGEVDKAWKKRRVEELIYDLGGIKEISNRLVVLKTPKKSEKAPISENQATAQEDNIISENIIAALEDIPNLNSENISVEVDSGEVTLSGRVENFQQYEAAEDAVLYRLGVHNIVNNLDIVEEFEPIEE
jgi:osmotically-inducible protein OsmY